MIEMQLVEKPRIIIAEARVNTKMNQREFAEFIGVDVSTVANWEKGKTESNVSQLKKDK